jgi:hypothetical protein
MLVRLYAVEAAALLFVVGTYKTTVINWNLLSTMGGATMVAGGIGVIASHVSLAREIWPGGSLRGPALSIAVATNLLAVLMSLFLFESTVRFVSRKTEFGVVNGSVAVRPTWPELVEHSRQILSDIASWGGRPSYFTFDAELGWTVGPNRQSPDGLYSPAAPKASEVRL